MRKSYIIWDNEQHGWLEARYVDWVGHKCDMRPTGDITQATRFSFEEIVKLSLAKTPGQTVFEG